MVAIQGHGGGCCGIAHVYGFGYGLAQVENLDEQIRRFEETQDGRVIEAVLTDNQLRAYANRRQNERQDYANWPAELAARGFRLVSRFRNSNSGNICNVFHRHPRWESLTEGLPFEWTAEIAEGIQPGTVARIPAAPVAPAPGDVDLNLPIEFTDGTPAVVVSRPTTARGNFTARATRALRCPNTRNDMAIPWNYSRDGRWIGDGRVIRIRNVQVTATVIGSTFHNVYASGRVGAGFDTLAEAQQAAPRCRNQRRRDFMSTGDPVWTDVVVNGVEQDEPEPAAAAEPDGLVIGQAFRYNNTNNPGHPENGNHYVLEALTPGQVIFNGGRRLAREHCRPFDGAAGEARGGRWVPVERVEELPQGTRLRLVDQNYAAGRRFLGEEGTLGHQGDSQYDQNRLIRLFYPDGRYIGAYQHRFERWIEE